MITTCIVLAEKESDETRRLENKVAFIHIPGEVESADIGELLEAVSSGSSGKYTVTLAKQGELPRDRKWIDLFFKTVDISGYLFMTTLSELCEPLRGNISWSKWALSHGRRPDLGGYEFFYLTPSKVKEFNLDQWSYPNVSLDKAIIYPAITSTRHANCFVINPEDWKTLQKTDSRCYVFLCHRPREKLPKEITEYINWGETECRTILKGRQRRGGQLVSETQAAQVRAKESKQFYGWYDLGSVIPVHLSTIFRAWRKTRFTLCKFPAVLDQALMSFELKKPINETQVKALLAYLNSSFTQLYVENRGLKTPGGIIQLDVSKAREIPVLNVGKLDDKQINSLAKLFDELEREARKIGGASSREQIEKLKPKIYEIDHAVATLLGIKDEDVKTVQAQVDLMVERRVSAAKGIGAAA